MNRNEAARVHELLYQAAVLSGRTVEEITEEVRKRSEETLITFADAAEKAVRLAAVGRKKAIHDRETVIRGMERFIDDFKPFCGNRNDWQRVYDALALLKEQEPRVMALEEVRNVGDDFVWTEIWTPQAGKWCLVYVKVKKCLDIEVFAINEDCGIGWTKNASEYGKRGFLDGGWRCWTSRPTNEQRENTPWEPPKEEEDDGKL